MQDLVSIIIPTYNRDHLIGETLDSIQGQTYTNWECIVIDDRSTDYTEELLSFYCSRDTRIRYFSLPEDRLKGANSCRNYGFELSKGNRIIWFDSDDLMLPGFVSKGIQLFEKYPDTDLVVSDYDIFNNEDNVVFHRQRNKIDQLEQDYFSGKVNFGNWAAIWKRAIVKNTKFDESLSRAQELDFHFRIFSSLNLNWKQLKGVNVKVRRHKDSLTTQFHKANLASLKSELRVRRKILSFLIENNYAKETVDAAFRIYLNTLRTLYRNHALKNSISELRELEKVLNKSLSYLKWEAYFLFLLYIYKFTGRDHKLKNHLFKLSRFADV
ncbi:glycosyltransferase family 2 protein [Salegentibacter chungangensis]|uniref:Glycosyltransferase family 2 protein n=1 Tax=Salegentibacter chungangensis TaxID=1335724 RepID=A0ABW3NRJ1_9FLAO